MIAQHAVELYGAQTGNCWRAAIALEEAGLPYRPRNVDLRLGEHKHAPFLAVNPAGKVPVLVDHRDGQEFVLAQSNAIVLYAAEAAPGTLTSATDPLARALAYERYFYFLTDVIAVSHAAFYLRGQTDTAASKTLTKRMLGALTFAERFLSDSEYMAGPAFTIADLAAVTITSTVVQKLEWSELPNLKRWFDQVMARASVIRGMKAFAQHAT